MELNIEGKELDLDGSVKELGYFLTYSATILHEKLYKMKKKLSAIFSDVFATTTKKSEQRLIASSFQSFLPHGSQPRPLDGIP